MSKLMNVKSASEILGVSEKKIWAMIYARELPVTRIGRAVRLSEQSVREYVDKATLPARCA